MDFTAYLKTRKLSPKTIESYKKSLKVYTNWLKEIDREAISINYTDLMDFLKHSREKGFKQRYINKLLGVIRHYYNYLKYTDQTQNNPASGLHLKGDQRRIPHDLLTVEQLEEIYTCFTQTGLAGKRNKLMLGLMIYQGLGTSELDMMEVDHLKLREGKIEIPGTRRSNRRILKLEAHQMLDMQEYISMYRSMILQLRKLAAEDPESQTYLSESQKLFVSVGTSGTLRGALDKLVRILRQHYEYFINAQQIRQSRIAIWIKHHDLRQVQYMAGHKYVSSTERYQSTNMEDLQKELSKHHPSSEES